MKHQLGSPAQLGKLADPHSMKRFLWKMQGGTAPVRSHGFPRVPSGFLRVPSGFPRVPSGFLRTNPLTTIQMGLRIEAANPLLCSQHPL